MNLQIQFFQILESLNFSNEIITKLWENMNKAYSSKARHYHNWCHIEAMMILFFEHHADIENPLEMQLAIFYHDIIYNVNRKDNEEKSAFLAVEIFKETTVKIDVLENLILSTKNHDAKTEDEKRIIDFDLAILGKGWEEYEIYCKNIRKEYRIYPNLLYKPGRKKVLKYFLEKERIFLTNEFFIKFEEAARKNLKNEIELL